MYYHGSFCNISGEIVKVEIVTRADRSQSMEIGGEGSLLKFSDDPVEITTGFNDSFDVLIRSEASIRFLAREFISDFFCASCRDAVVNIYKGNRCVFAGFIEPQAYSQGFNEVWDELTLSCIDALSALQYSKYRDLDAPGNEYKDALKDASTLSMGEIVSSMLGKISSELRITGTGSFSIWYDRSRAMTSVRDYRMLYKVGVSELLFLGAEEDEVWTQEEVLEEMLRYLNLHIVQEGFDFFIFAWESVAGASNINWLDMKTGDGKYSAHDQVILSAANATDADTTISIGEVYNRISLMCDLDTLDTMIESPLDSSALTSPYSGKQLYMREYVVECTGKNGGNTDKDKTAFNKILQGKRTDHEKAYTRDWYLRIMDHPSWSFPDRHTGTDLISKYCKNNSNQQNLPNQLAKQLGACLVSWGSVKEMSFRKDDSIPGKMDMTQALVVAINGNRTNSASEGRPNESDILAAAPVAVYTGSVSGGTYSPADADTTNYIVFSGSIVLNMKSLDSTIEVPLFGMPAFDNYSGSGKHLSTLKYFKADTPRSHAIEDPSVTSGLQPFMELDAPTLEYSISEDGSELDTLSKIPVLRCMLVIGDKCVVETGEGYSVHDFEWKPFKERSQCADDAEYYAQSFTLGFNPAIGDKLIGKEYKLLNNIPYYLDVDAEGTAIPIKRSDGISGPVRFIIVGPVNAVWNETKKVHQRWPYDDYLTDQLWMILPMLANIVVKDFEVKIYSDNAGMELTEECDLVYMSDTGESFINEKDDITFRISSALTADERRELGVAEAVRKSTAIDMASGLGITQIYDHVKGSMAKPEQSYVDSYYSEFHVPRVTMQQHIVDSEDKAGLFLHYKHPAMPDRTFYVQAVGRNLRMNEALLTLKERWV